MHFIKHTLAMLVALTTGTHSLPIETASDNLAVRNDDVACAGELCGLKIKVRNDDIACAGELCGL